MVASTLTGISGDDHVRHHFVDSSLLLELGGFQKLLEKAQENCVLESLFLVPMAFTLVLRKLSERGLDDSERELFGYFILSEHLFFKILIGLD